MEKLAAFGLYRDKFPAEADFDAARDSVLDKCHWKISQYKKFSEPTRIAEAVPNLDFVIARAKGKRDVTPHYTRAVALSRIPGREAEAAKAFDEVMPDLTFMEFGQVSALWARAEWTRLLRRQGEIEKAKEQEEWLRDWYRGHPMAMPPSKFARTVLAEGEDTNVILEGIPNFGAGIHEIPGMGGAFVTFG